jgi:hypothetical protein
LIHYIAEQSSREDDDIGLRDVVIPDRRLLIRVGEGFDLVAFVWIRASTGAKS